MSSGESHLVLTTPSSVSPKRRRPAGVARLHSRRGGQTNTRLDEAEYQYPGGPNLAIKVGEAAVSNSTLVIDLLGVTSEEYTASQMTYDLRRLRLKGLIFRPPKTDRLLPDASRVEGCPPIFP